MTETRKLAAILVSDVVGYSRLAGADEEGVLARLRALRRELIDPKIALHKGRVVESTGDGVIVEFRSAVDAVRAAIEVQTAMVDRNAGIPEDRQIVFRIGVHVGDVIEESDGDLMGDGDGYDRGGELGRLTPSRPQKSPESIFSQWAVERRAGAFENLDADDAS